MTEAEWDKYKNPVEMYYFVRDQPGALRSKACRRKLRLFGVACCQQLGREMSDPRSLAAVEVAERLADGRASKEEASRAEKEARQAYEDAFQAWLYTNGPVRQARGTSLNSAQSAVLLLDRRADNFGPAALCRPVPTDAPNYRTYLARGQWQAGVLRCVFGNPFRPVMADPSWRTETVVALAEGIYADRAFDRLPILADALEEAGCAAAELLVHCRGSGPHVRGCWAVDLILAKQ